MTPKNRKPRVTSKSPSETWIIGATLLTQDSKRRAVRANLRISGNRIAALTQQSPPRSRKPSIQILDASGLVILPGFVHTHVHLCQTLFRNYANDLDLVDWLKYRIWPLEASHTPESLYHSAVLGIRELLSTGGTTVLDMATVRHTESVLKAVDETGIRASVGKCLMDNPKTTPVELRDRSTQDAVAEATSLFQKWNGLREDRIRISYAPRFVVSCTADLLKQVRDLSREQNALVHSHSSENLREIRWVEKLVGSRNLTYWHRLGLTGRRLVLAHCIHLSRSELKILEKTGTHVSHCPSSNLKLASGFAPIPEMLRRGISVSLGADGAPCNNNLNMFQEMRLAALIHKPGSGPKAIRAQEALDMATINGARALGWDDQIGSIEVGKKADLIAVDLSDFDNRLEPLPRRAAQLTSKYLSKKSKMKLPSTRSPCAETLAGQLVYSSSAKHLKWTMVDGKILFRSKTQSFF